LKNASASRNDHRSNPLCASCHARFDSFGLAFENFGPVGERRERDLAGRPVEVDALLPGGVQARGTAGVRDYIRQHRQDDYLENITRKLWTYALNRTPILSDEPALERLRAQLPAAGYRFGTLVETIVASPQFLNRRHAE